MVSMDMYVAPITLGFTPANGDFIRGTVNGVEVSGEWNDGVALCKGALDVSTYGSAGGQRICIIDISDGQAVVVVQQDSTPTTDYELHLYRYTPADIVQIPQEYVEGLEATAADATAAKTAAETAQSTANAAQTAAETAQSTANNAKTTAETAQSTANSAKLEPNQWNYTSSLVSKDKKILGWFATRIGLEYNATNGSFYRSIWETDPMPPNQIPENYFYSDGYFSINGSGARSALLILKRSVISSKNAWLVKGLAFFENGKIYRVETPAISQENATGLFLEFTSTELLPTVTASDSGKFLRVSSTGAWEAETTVIPSQPIIVDAEADMSTGSLQISSEDDIQKMNAIDAAYKAGKPCSAYLRYLVNDSYIWCALIATIASSDLCNFLFASSSPNNLIRVAPSTNGNWTVSIDGPTDDSK